MDVYAETLAAHNWSMYDISLDLRRGSTQSWQELAARGPAQQALDGGTYLLAPNPLEGESLDDAVTRQQGIGAHLRIRDVNSPDYAGLTLFNSPNFAFFTRIAIRAAHVRLYSYVPPRIRGTDDVRLAHDMAAAVFARDFGVMTFEEYRAEFDRWH